MSNVVGASCQILTLASLLSDLPVTISTGRYCWSLLLYMQVFLISMEIFPLCALSFFPCWCVQKGDLEQVKNLLEQHRGIVDFKSGITGDTSLIAAAKAGHSEVRLSSAVAVVVLHVYSQECNGHVE